MVAAELVAQRHRTAAALVVVDLVQSDRGVALVVDEPFPLVAESAPSLVVALGCVESDLDRSVLVLPDQELHLLVPAVEEAVETDLEGCEVADVEDDPAGVVWSDPRPAAVTEPSVEGVVRHEQTRGEEEDDRERVDRSKAHDRIVPGTERSCNSSS